MKSKVAVVILNWNGKKFLEKFLPDIIRFSKDEAVIYVIDNFSTDNSIEFIKKNFTEIEIISLDKNYGFTGGYNLGLKKIDAEYYILLNSDVEVTAGWITPIINLMDADKLIAACQPKILDYKNKANFEYAGAAGGFIDYLGYPFCRGRIFNSIEKDNGQYNDAQQVFWATGACMFIRKSAFTATEGFDESFFAHMEEIDLCWRLQLLGFKIFIEPKSTVYHIGGGTLNKYSAQKTYFNFRNNRMMLYKNVDDAKLKNILFKRFLLDMAAALQFLFTSGPSHCFAVIKAYKDYKIWKRKSHLLRNKIQASKKTSLLPLIYQHSIIAKYYLSKIKKYDVLKKYS